MRGYKEGLQHLKSENFKDFFSMDVKPAFGIPTVHFGDKAPVEQYNNTEEHSQMLWGMIAKNLLHEGAMEGCTPRLIQLI